MISKLYQKTYPFLSIGAIELGKFIENLGHLFNILILLLQIIIGVLTILKIYVEVKQRVFKSAEETEENVKQKYPFLSALLNFLKSKK